MLFIHSSLLSTCAREMGAAGPADDGLDDEDPADDATGATADDSRRTAEVERGCEVAATSDVTSDAWGPRSGAPAVIAAAASTTAATPTATTPAASAPEDIAPADSAPPVETEALHALETRCHNAGRRPDIMMLTTPTLRDG